MDDKEPTDFDYIICLAKRVYALEKAFERIEEREKAGTELVEALLADSIENESQEQLN